MKRVNPRSSIRSDAAGAVVHCRMKEGGARLVLRAPNGSTLREVEGLTMLMGVCYVLSNRVQHG
jgi:hypothetical protein